MSTTVMNETSGRKFKDEQLCTPLVVTKKSCGGAEEVGCLSLKFFLRIRSKQ